MGIAKTDTVGRGIISGQRSPIGRIERITQPVGCQVKDERGRPCNRMTQLLVDGSPMCPADLGFHFTILDQVNMFAELTERICALEARLHDES